MRRSPLTLLILLFISTCLLAAAPLGVSTFTASYQSTDVRLDWSVSEETGVTRYEVYRKRGEEESFQKLTSVDPSGEGQYHVIDDNLYKNTDAPHSMEYRLTVVAGGAQETHYYASISHNPTAIQRSWGSIKSMFR
ncbi:MAG: hypothetical protein WBA12_05085 [Catalinimonas sp.]